MRTILANEFSASFVHADRIEAQRDHGQRVEERQRVNGQPNGYQPISEAELQVLRAGRAE
jgi:hypothetical protein